MNKCDSILGHKFEPRYDTKETDSELGKAMGCASRISGSIDPAVLKLVEKTYRGDVCVHCGQWTMPNA